MESDERLLEDALRGDEESFAVLYRRRNGPVYRFALHMSGDTTVAEDVTQEVFLALLQTGKRFDPLRGNLLSFLYGIARNQVLRRLETKRPQESGDLDDPAAGDLLEDLTRRETVEHVRRAVLSLPPLYREVVALCDLEGASYEEAAEAINCPVGTVRSRLSRGRALLAQKLTPTGARSL
jgi:RNA polymerase sigma-70 factor, ECF subfamily